MSFLQALMGRGRLPQGFGNSIGNALQIQSPQQMGIGQQMYSPQQPQQQGFGAAMQPQGLDEILKQFGINQGSR